MNFDDRRFINRMRIYRSTDPDLPLHQWRQVAEVSVWAPKWIDDLSSEPKVRHYYYARYVYVDGRVGAASAVQSAVPVANVKAGDQNPDSN